MSKAERYFTLYVPWEPDPAKRTVWHPTEPTGPFAVLCRGAFWTAAGAQAWADEHLGLDTDYTIRLVRGE